MKIYAPKHTLNNSITILFSLVILFFTAFALRKVNLNLDNAKPIAVVNESIYTVWASNVATIANGDISKKFFQEVQFPLITKNIEEVYYGNKEIGYFKTKDFRLKPGNLFVGLVPPTYKSEIEFLVKPRGEKIYSLGWIKFDSPLPPMFQRMKAKVKGKFTVPFMIMSGQFLPPGSMNNIKDRFSYVFIVNKLGEMVWTHFPKSGEYRMRKYGLMKPYAKGKFALVFGERTSYIELVNYKGNLLKSLDPQAMRPPVVVHHDFIYNPKRYGEDNIISLSNEVAYKRGFTKNTSFTQKIKQLLDGPFSVVSSNIGSLNFKKMSYQKLWRGLDHFDPFEEIEIRYSQKGFKFKDEYSYLKQGGAKEWAAKGLDVQIDHIHANAIQEILNDNGSIKGYLITSRNDNRVFMLDKDFREVLWSVGHREVDTYKTVKELDRFYFPHDAKLLPNGDVLIFDNHPSPPGPRTRGSRILQLRLDHLLNTAEIVWQWYPPKPYFVSTRGMVDWLPNGNILAHFPVAKDLNHYEQGKMQKGHNTYDMTYEINYKTDEIIAEMEVSFETPLGGGKTTIRGAGNRAIPIYSIGMESMVINKK